MFDIHNLIRPHLRDLGPSATIQETFRGHATILLYAAENSFGSPVTGVSEKGMNRYPDPLQWKLKEKISRIKGVPPMNMFIGNGSDEVIDLLVRACCTPGTDHVLVMPPTYGTFERAAAVNGVDVRKVPSLPDFQPDMDAVAEAIDEHTKIIFICSPNNPTGNTIDAEVVESILVNFNGLVVLDEAFINYSRQKTAIGLLRDFPNLVVLQTLSKAWGMAGLRVGMAFASEDIINVLNKIKQPYNVSETTQELALQALEQVEQINGWIKQTVAERENLAQNLAALPFVEKVFPSEANFVLVRFADATAVYKFLLGKGIVVSDRTATPGCEGCLRITVGTPEENKIVLQTLSKFGA